MLYEVKRVKQYKNEGFRRWFTDSNFDLIIWYDNNRIIKGFQLCYNKNIYERALTWSSADNTYVHNRIDDGEMPGAIKESPILVADGLFDKIRIAKEFKENSHKIDRKIASFIYNKILEY